MIDPVVFVYLDPVPSKKSYRFTKAGKKGEEMRRLKARIKGYEAGIGWEARRAGAHRVLARIRANHPGAKASISVYAFNQRPDPDNLWGCIMDGIKGVAIPDDSPNWIWRAYMEYVEDDGATRVGVKIAWRT